MAEKDKFVCTTLCQQLKHIAKSNNTKSWATKNTYMRELNKICRDLFNQCQVKKLENTVLTPKGLNRGCVGRDAKTLLGMIGVTVPDNIRCIIFEGEKEDKLIAEELMMPILGIVKAKDFEDAVEKGIMLGTKRFAMTTDASQFTLVNDIDATDVTGYAIFKDGTIVFDK